MDKASHYPRNRLRRNAACQRCNQRKTKCDAVRPTCGACVRHNRHRQRSKTDTGPAITCIYDDPPDDGRSDHEQGQDVSGENLASGSSSVVATADWPVELPSRALLNHLVGIFFASVPSINHLIHEARFLSRLSRSPSHPDFPHLALLHAICAVAARFTAAVQIETVEDNVKRRSRVLDGKKVQPSTSNTVESPQCFAEHHARQAAIVMNTEETCGRGNLDMCQAQIILVTHYFYTAQFHKSFLMAGQAFRLGHFVGLLREVVTPNQESDRWSTLLPKPIDDTDREERRRLACSLVFTDTAVSLCGAWPLALIPEELAVKLPAAYTDFQNGSAIPENPQSIRKPSLFEGHPVEDSFVMYIKSTMLLRLVVDFRRKTELANDTRTDGRVEKFDELVFAYLKRTCGELFEKLPSSLVDPVTSLSESSNAIDPDLLGAHIVPRIAMIVHCEPYAHIDDPECEHSRSTYYAAFGVAAICQRLLARGVDWKVSVVPLAAHWLQIASRSLLQHYRHALRSADLSTVTAVSTALDTIKEALSKIASHNAVAYLVHKHIQSKLDEINKGVFVDPAASLDPGLFQTARPQDPVNDFRWDDALLWPMNFDNDDGLPRPSTG